MIGDHESFVDIKTPFNQEDHSQRTTHFKNILQSSLAKILPASLCKPISSDPDLLEDQKKRFQSLLPLICSTLNENNDGHFSFYCLSKMRPDSFKFFSEMISHWLIPGRRLNLSFIYSVDFAIPEYCEETLNLAEVVITVEGEKEKEEIKRNFPILLSDLKLGMHSSYYARKILEIKGLSVDAKTVLIQEQLVRMISRFPVKYDYDLLTEMQHVLVSCLDDFKEKRLASHLQRLIVAKYTFRKNLLDLVKKYPERRHLCLKIFDIATPNKEKSTLGVVVGINFLEDNELFEERHLLAAIQNYVPNANAVSGSFFSSRRGNENICTLYLEIEKSGEDTRFTSKEIRTLRNELPSDLRDRIEHLMHPIFMTRNEEEIMRNILTLSNQIKYIHDMPQVIISFDKQTHTDLFFTIILVKVKKPGDANVVDLFQLFNTKLEYSLERVKNMGFLRKKYLKEATVFSVKINKDQFLRRDSSIDLNRARQSIVAELARILGDIRDFNGGIISKQNELLCGLRQQLDGELKYNELLLENFFYSLTPDVMRTVLEPAVLKNFFALLLESIDKGLFSGQENQPTIRKDASHVFVMITSEESNLRETMNKAISKLGIPPGKLGSSLVVVYNITYLGYLYICDDPALQQAFCTAIEEEISLHLTLAR